MRLHNMFNTDALKAGIKASDDNIKTFEEAIQKERDTQEEYRGMIATIERKEMEAGRTITLEAERE